MNWEEWLGLIHTELSEGLDGLWRAIGGRSNAATRGVLYDDDWWCRAALGRGIPDVNERDSGPGFGLYVEATTSPPKDGWPERSDASHVELCVRLPVPRQRFHDDLEDELANKLSAALNVGEPLVESEAVLYPYEKAPPVQRPFIVKMNPAVAQRGRSVQLTVRSGESVNWGSRAPSEALAETIAKELSNVLPAFLEVAYRLKDSVGEPRESSAVRNAGLIGFLGEYVVSQDPKYGTWVGGNKDHDFRTQADFIEVKTAVGGFPVRPYFTANEIRLALAQQNHYRVVQVSLEPRAVSKLINRLANATDRARNVRRMREWAQRMAAAVGTDLRVIAANMRGLRADLRRVVRTARVQDTARNPFMRRPLDSLGAVQGHLGSGSIQISIA